MDDDAQFQQRLLDKQSQDLQWESPSTVPAHRTQRRRRPGLMVWCWAGQAVLFAMSMTALAFSYQWRFSAPSTQRCVEKLSPPSPALSAISDEYETRRFTGTLGAASPYMGRPTEERVEHWRKLQRPRSFGLTREQLLELGASEDSVQIPEEDGGGYMAVLEVYHHIHCVEELWKYTWPDYYQSWAGEPDSVFRKHLDHCADMVRQKLMCDGDVTPLTFNWVKGFSHPVPNFNVLHKCRSYDAINDWAREHEIKSDWDANYTKPADAVELDGIP